MVLKFDGKDEADLSDLGLSGPTQMVVKVSKSLRPNSIASLDGELRKRAEFECKKVLEVENMKSSVLGYIEENMMEFAPNLCELVGTKTAALLVGTAGGLDKLANIPSNNIQVLGRKSAVRADTGAVHGGNATLHKHAGVLGDCPLVLSAPPDLRRKTLRVVAGRVRLCAGVDLSKREKSSGKLWKMEIEEKINKWREPGPGKSEKPLPIPDAARPKRRGGRRARKEKEKMGMTQMRALANREQFGGGSDDADYAESAMGMDLGMLSKNSNGRVRGIQIKDTQKLAQQASKKLRAINTIGGGAGQGASGFSSLAFTPVQGMELAPSSYAGKKTERVESNSIGVAGSAAAPKKLLPPVPAFADR